MKILLPFTTLCFAQAFTVMAHAAFGPIPNGDFESPAGEAGAWLPVSDPAGSFAFSYPSDGGNSGGYGVIDHTSGTGYGLWVANNGNTIPLTELGLAAGRTYTFQMDMKRLSGVGMGGLKVEFYTGATLIGHTGDMRPTEVAEDWTTFSFPVTIRAGTDRIKVVPVWGPNSAVGFDNIRIKEPEPLAATIRTGTLLKWPAAAAGSTYQPQWSANGVDWENRGPVIAGASPNFWLDTRSLGYFQVVEFTPGAAGNLVENSGFEVAGGGSLGSSGWSIVVQPNTGASMTIASEFEGLAPHGGGSFLKFESTTPASGPEPAPPNTDVRSAFIPVTEGTEYELSFYAANPVKIGGANPQYTIAYYTSGNAPVGGVGFTSFSSVGGLWTKVTRTLTPPAGAAKLTIGWVQAMGAVNGWRWVTLIDDVSLTSGPAGEDVTSIATLAIGPGAEVTWNTQAGERYQFQSTTDFADWSDLGAPVTGTGGFLSATDFYEGTEKFWRAKVVP